jgi:hypothetical protein
MSYPNRNHRDDRAIWKLIDANIPAKDRNVVYDELAILPRRARTNVLIYSGGRFYSNHLWMLRGARAYEGHIPHKKSTVSERGAATCTTNNGGTGVDHKFCTEAGFQFFSSSVAIACHDSYLFGSLKENGYVYSGGTSPQGFEVDAGLQVNGPTPPGAPYSVSAFITLPNGTSFKSVGAPSIHVPCDIPVDFEFWAAQKNESDPVSFVDFVPGYGTLMYQLQGGNNGWSQICSCVIKRVTSLAFPGSLLEAGSYFGVQDPQNLVTPSNNGATPDITWTGVTQGYFSTYGSNATAATEPWVSTQAYDDPSNAEQIGLVLAHPYDSTHEDVGINETQPIVIQLRHKPHD